MASFRRVSEGGGRREKRARNPASSAFAPQPVSVAAALPVPPLVQHDDDGHGCLAIVAWRDVNSVVALQFVHADRNYVVARVRGIGVPAVCCTTCAPAHTPVHKCNRQQKRDCGVANSNHCFLFHLIPPNGQLTGARKRLRAATASPGFCVAPSRPVEFRGYLMFISIHRFRLSFRHQYRRC